MKKLHAKNTVILLFFVLLGNFSVFAQKKSGTPKKTTQTNKVVEVVKPTERPVTVLLKAGDSLKGTFINASPEGIQVLISGNMLILKWNDIGQVVFTDVVSNEAMIKNDPPTNKNKEAVENALKSLRKLAAATEVGVTFQEYGRRLIDVKVEIEQFLPEIYDGYVKDEIRLAMEAYADASTGWNEMSRGYLFPSLEPGKSLQSKYSIPIDRSIGMELLPQNSVLSIIWATARKHIENASKGETK